MWFVLLGLPATKPLWYAVIPSRHHISISNSVTQDCDIGCILVVPKQDLQGSVVCAQVQYITMVPDTDNMYHLTVYSGFPYGQDNEKYTNPLYKQEYTWSEDYGRVSLDQNNCLKVARELDFFLNSWERFC